LPVRSPLDHHPNRGRATGNIPATEFKARCLEILDRVAERRESYVITKRGKPVAKLVPADPPRRKDIFGCMVGRKEIVGHLDRPLWSEEEWKELERQRVTQARAWEEEWRSYGTISGRKTIGRPLRRAKGVRRGPGR
jgi:prevent-host-death family protein